VMRFRSLRSSERTTSPSEFVSSHKCHATFMGLTRDRLRGDRIPESRLPKHHAHTIVKQPIHRYEE
jgi:hypothetical protein